MGTFAEPMAKRQHGWLFGSAQDRQSGIGGRAAAAHPWITTVVRGRKCRLISIEVDRLTRFMRPFLEAADEVIDAAVSFGVVLAGAAIMLT